MPGGWAEEIEGGQRFAFGKNWEQFLGRLTEQRIEAAENSLREMLGVQTLAGRTFLDVGSGSGLFSLAARRLGATVTSFDFDPQSVQCTAELKKRYYPGDKSWAVRSGSALNRTFLRRLGRFDIVYSWGVLHHTGAMWQALENVLSLVGEEGWLFIALYNDQGKASQRWRMVKRAYCATPATLRWLVLFPALARLWGPTFIRDSLRGRPLKSWRGYSDESGRGMDPWRDLVDWVGGFPFEVARPEQVLDFCGLRGLELVRLKTCGGGLGCNEFVFQRKNQAHS